MIISILHSICPCLRHRRKILLLDFRPSYFYIIPYIPYRYIEWRCVYYSNSYFLYILYTWSLTRLPPISDSEVLNVADPKNLRECARLAVNLAKARVKTTRCEVYRRTVSRWHLLRCEDGESRKKRLRYIKDTLGTGAKRQA